MADEKKPKIDLKSRLQKMGGGAPQAAGSGTAMPVPAPGRSGAPMPIPPPSVPPPVGLRPSAAPAALDPNNPLAAAAAGTFRSTAAPPRAEPAAPTRIEVDEHAVHDARKGVRRQMFVFMGVASLVTAAIGFAAGGASEKSSNRGRAKQDATQLKDAVGKAKDSLTQLADKLQAGTESLAAKPPKFPETLSKDLAGINVDFDGSQLAARRFDGFGNKTTQGLVEFVTKVQGVNDRKKLVQSLLTRLQKPITDMLAAANNAPPISFVVVIDKKNPAETYFGPLSPAFTPTKDKPNPPDKLTFVNPQGGKTELPKWTGGDLKDPVVVPVMPAALERAFPSTEKGQIAQLVSQLVGLRDSIRRDKNAQQPGGLEEDVKADMIELASQLSDDLTKAAQ
jgi:hypothetical protein